MPSPDRILATVLFTDVVDSARHVVQVGDQRWRELLDRHDAIMRRELQRFRGPEIKATGDGFLAAFDGPGRAVHCALSATQAMRNLGLDLRVGVHTGECEERGDDLGGIAVHLGARIAALAEPGEVLVSRTVTYLVVGSGLEFTDRGQHQLEGVPGMRPLFGAEEIVRASAMPPRVGYKCEGVLEGTPTRVRRAVRTLRTADAVRDKLS